MAKTKAKTWYTFTYKTDPAMGFLAYKYSDDGEHLDTYILNHNVTLCNCPARVPMCRHKQMLNKFLLEERVDTGWQYCFETQEWRAPNLIWEDTREVVLDTTMQFGTGYDHTGWEHMRSEAASPAGRWAIWPDALGSNSKWNAYCEGDGLYVPDLESEVAAKAYVRNKLYGEQSKMGDTGETGDTGTYDFMVK